MTCNPFSIPLADTWYIEGNLCPYCKKKHGLHSGLYTDGIIESCGYCGFIRKLKSPYPRSQFLQDIKKDI